MRVRASSAQRRLWFLDQLRPESAAYNNANILRIRGPLNVKRLESALRDVAQRHEPLHSRFTERAGEPEIETDPDLLISLSFEEIVADFPSGESLAHERASALASVPFVLGEAPLARWHLLRLEDEEHWLVYVVHHAVSDRWSLGVWLQDLSAFLQGDEPEPLTMTYGEYADAQEESFGAAETAASLRFYQDMLGNGPYQFDFPTDTPRRAQRRERGQTICFDLTPHQAALRVAAKRLRASPYMVAFTAFQVWAAHTTGDWSPLFATFVAGRDNKALAPLVGLFVNTLALRFELNDDPTFAEAVKRTRKTWLAAQPHAGLPFEKLVDGLSAGRDLSRTPIAQVAFNFHNVPVPPLTAGELCFELLEVKRESARYDLTLTLRPTKDALIGELEYDSDLFHPSSADRFAAHFDFLLGAALSQPEQHVRSLPMIPKADLCRPIEPHPEKVELPEVSLLKRLMDLADHQPLATAVRFADRTLTYQELAVEVSRTAAYYRKNGVSEGQRVGICVPRSERMLITVLALFGCGAAYVPLDRVQPLERLRLIAEDAGLDAVIGESENESFASDVPWLPESPPEDFEGPCSLYAQPDRDALAYVIYTSGSTGIPKGVCVSHGNMGALWVALDARLDPPSTFRLLAVTTLSFDISVLELFWPLWCGSQVVIADEQTARDGRLLAMAAEQVDFLQATPASMRMLMETGFVPTQHQTLLCGGEALSSELAAALIADGATLHNVYGPTETTVWSSSWRVPPESDSVFLGTALPNEWLHVMDAAGRPVAPGASGELWIGGAGVALGYHDRPELTADRFVPDPFDPLQRCYRTGDLVRQDSKDQLCFIGRTDGQIKLHGHRMELGEIETCLGKAEGVEAAVVRVHGDGPRAFLVAYYTAHKGSSLCPDSNDLRVHVEQSLPAAMRPTQFVRLDSFPLTPSGKIQRQALEPPARELSRSEASPPKDDVESRLAAIWSEVLSIGMPGMEDDFFALGGNSLLAVRMLHEVETILGVEVDLASFFLASDLKEFSENVRKGGVSNQTGVIHLSKGSNSVLWMLRGLNIYREFAEALPESLGCGAIYLQEEVSGLLDSEVEADSIEQMAERYADLIQESQPEGPYRLGGLSFGGIVAFETARCLQKRKAEVDLVVLLDSLLPGARKRALGDWFMHHLTRVHRQGFRKTLTEIRLLIGSRLASTGGTDEVDIEQDLMGERRRMYDISMSTYQPAIYEGRVLLLLSKAPEINPGWRFREDLGWGDVKADLTIAKIDAMHVELVEAPYVDEVVRHVSAALKLDPR
ncbi:MAG: hypothetical protein CL917_08560 [Deltaproteobacteria bacterium]|nr:hypothetical protein [Deltaproteobacteria bacterium]